MTAASGEAFQKGTCIDTRRGWTPPPVSHFKSAFDTSSDFDSNRNRHRLSSYTLFFASEIVPLLLTGWIVCGRTAFSTAFVLKCEGAGYLSLIIGGEGEESTAVWTTSQRVCESGIWNSLTMSFEGGPIQQNQKISASEATTAGTSSGF